MMEVTPDGPLTFTVPFTASMLLSENFQIDQSTQQLYHYSGAGLATLSFSRYPTAPSGSYEVSLTSATFDFQSIPEPGMLAMVGLGFAFLLLFHKRVLKKIRSVS